MIYELCFLYKFFSLSFSNFSVCSFIFHLRFVIFYLNTIIIVWEFRFHNYSATSHKILIISPFRCLPTLTKFYIRYLWFYSSVSTVVRDGRNTPHIWDMVLVSFVLVWCFEVESIWCFIFLLLKGVLYFGTPGKDIQRLGYPLVEIETVDFYMSLRTSILLVHSLL